MQSKKYSPIKSSPKKVKIKTENIIIVESPTKKHYFTDGETIKSPRKDQKEKVDLKHAIKSLKTIKKFLYKILFAIKGILCTCNASELDKHDLLT